MKGKLVVLTGPSGVGKTTVANRLLEDMPNLTKLVTYTTREAREGEKNGVHYNFVSEDEFRAKIEAGEMFEWATVYDKYYGNAKSDLESLLGSGKDVLMVIDVQGAKTVEEIQPDAVSIFLNAESRNAMISRLEKRGQNKKQDLELRIRELDQELGYREICDYEVINADGKVEETVEEVKKLVS